jgi:hypothetical protein
MAFINYSDLKNTIASYLGRSDLTAAIPDFINMAEFRMRRQLRTRQMLKSATSVMTPGDNTIGLPVDFLEMRDIYIQGNPRQVISYITPSSFTRNARTEERGVPNYYTILGDELSFAPIPDAEYVLDMLYFYKPDLLSDTVPSNIFLANFPDVLLYGSLAEAEPYLMNDARIQTWISLYDRAISNIIGADDYSEYSGVPLAMKLTSR